MNPEIEPVPIPDRRRPEPLWHQVAQSVRISIEQGVWQPGDQIPSEDRLCETWGVSRITVRHAIGNLVDEGLLRRDHGRGTFVRSSSLIAGQRGLTSFTEEVEEMGLVVSSQLLDVSVIPAEGHVAQALQVDPETGVLSVRRLRLGDSEPFGIQTAHLRLDRLGGEPVETIAAELGGGSLYRYLKARHGIVPEEGVETYRVAAAEPDDATLLEVEPGTPVFMVERLTTDSRGPFELAASILRGDRYEVKSTLRAD